MHATQYILNMYDMLLSFCQAIDVTVKGLRFSWLIFVKAYFSCNT